LVATSPRRVCWDIKQEDFLSTSKGEGARPVTETLYTDREAVLTDVTVHARFARASVTT
jgi:hypothetical protein